MVKKILDNISYISSKWMSNKVVISIPFFIVISLLIFDFYLSVKDRALLADDIELYISGEYDQNTLEVVGISRNDDRIQFEREYFTYTSRKKYLKEIIISNFEKIEYLELKIKNRIEIIEPINYINQTKDSIIIPGNSQSLIPIFRGYLNYSGDVELLFQILILLLKIISVGTLSIFIYFIFKRYQERLIKSFVTVIRSVDKTKIDIFPYVIVFLLFFNFLSYNFTGIEWPATDMGPFFERLSDPNFTPNDFLTNSYQIPNPRHIFGYSVHYLSQVLNLKWYELFFALKLSFFILIPLLYYYLIKFLLDSNNSTINFLIALFVLLPQMNKDVLNIFEIAYWPVYYNIPSANVTAHLFGILYNLAYLKYWKSKSINFFLLSMGFLFLAVLYHPANGLFLFIFSILININTLKKENIIKWVFPFIILMIISVLFPAVILETFFGSTVKLNAEDFILHYIKIFHPFHYQISSLINYDNYPWYYDFLLILLMMFGNIILALRQKKSIVFEIMSILSMILAVVSQFIFIEVIPSKLIAIISPIRFSFLFYWLVVISFVKNLANFQKSTNPIRTITSVKIFNFFVIPLAFLLITISTYNHLQNEDTYQKMTNFDPWFFEWLKTTDPNSVFLHHNFTNPYTGFDIHLVGRRALFAHPAFPFNEDFFQEHTERHNLCFGVSKFLNEEPEETFKLRYKFFLSLKLEDFNNINKKYRLDYVVITKNELEKMNLPRDRIVFYNNYVVFKVRD